MLYIPPALLRKVGAKVWRDHVEAWDGIFNQGRTTIHDLIYVFLFWVVIFLKNLTMCIIWGVSGSLHPKHLQALASGDWPFKEVSWCLGQPAPAGQAVHWRHQSQHNWADGWGSRHGQQKNQRRISICFQQWWTGLFVFQTSITLLWTLYELARHPNLQEELRAEVAAARAESQGDMLEMLKRIPLVKGALKETLR